MIAIKAQERIIDVAGVNPSENSDACVSRIRTLRQVT